MPEVMVGAAVTAVTPTNPTSATAAAADIRTDFIPALPWPRRRGVCFQDVILISVSRRRAKTSTRAGVLGVLNRIAAGHNRARRALIGSAFAECRYGRSRVPQAEAALSLRRNQNQTTRAESRPGR